MVFLMAVKSEQSMQRLPENGKRCFQAAKLFLYLSFIYLFFTLPCWPSAWSELKSKLGFSPNFFFGWLSSVLLMA